MIDLKTKVKNNILDLGSCNITVGDIESITKFIEDNPYITSLNLCNNGIGPEVVVILAQSPHLTNLTELNLKNNFIEFAGIEALAGSAAFSQLTNLYLLENDIGSEGAEALANSKNLKNLTELDLSDNEIDFEGAEALANSKNLKNLTNLDLSNNNIGSEGAEALANSKNLKNLTNLDLLGNNIDSKGAEALANSENLKNLTNLDLSSNKIGSEGAEALANSKNLKNLTELDLSDNEIDFEGVKALADSKNFTNLTNLNLSHNEIGYEGVKALADSKNFTNLTNLDLSHNDIGSEGVEALANSENLKNLTKLDLEGNIIDWVGERTIADSPNLKNLTMLNLAYNHLDAEGAVNMAKLANNRKYHLVIDNINQIIITSLSTVYKENGDNAVIPSEIVQNLIFKLAPTDNNGNHVRYFLEHPDEYPFAINYLDSEGNTLGHYYHNHPGMQIFLFERGLLPRQESSQTMGDLAANTQGVHDKEITWQNHFVVSEMMKSYGQDRAALLTSADSCRKDIENLWFSPLEVELLNLSESEKINSLNKIEEFIQMVTKKSIQILKDEYLDNNSEYYNHQNAYNEQGETITIPETIGLVYCLINNHEFPIEEKKELLVTLIEKNPKLVKDNLKLIQDKLGQDVTIEQLSKRAKCHKLLDGTSSETIKELFNEISGGLDINESLKKQKLFIAARSLYWAATTYGRDEGACIAGTWAQTANAAGIINPEYLTKYAGYKDKKLAEERLKGSITAENIGEFIPNLWEKLMTISEDNSSFKKTLAEFYIYPIDFDNPREITIEQQQVIGKIYQIFSQEIKEYLPNYNRLAPKFEEYQIIVEELGKDQLLKRFTQEYYKEGQQELEVETRKIAAGTYAERVTQWRQMIKQRFKTASLDIGEKMDSIQEQKGWAEKIAAGSTSNQQEIGSRKRVRSNSLSSSPPAKRVRTNSDNSLSR